MKIATLLTTLALACGGAYANTSGTATHSNKQQTTAAEQSGTTHEGVGIKTKRTFHKMGDKMRSTGHKLAHATRTDKRADNDTRAMGAAGSDTQDGARRQRMDSAYDSWKNRQQR